MELMWYYSHLFARVNFSEGFMADTTDKNACRTFTLLASLTSPNMLQVVQKKAAENEKERKNLNAYLVCILYNARSIICELNQITVRVILFETLSLFSVTFSFYVGNPTVLRIKLQRIQF